MPPTPHASDSRAPVHVAQRWTLVLRVVQLRLRFVAVLAALLAVLLGWQQLRSWWDRASGWWETSALPAGGVSPDTEYFCPMCPGVITQWPEKCPVCKMPLVRRKIGDARLLPEGVLARMQLSPQRIQLGGIQTSVVQYRPLERRFNALATWQRDADDPLGGWIAVAWIGAADAAHVQTGQAVELSEADNSAGPSWAGTVNSLESSLNGRGGVNVRISSPDEDRGIAEGTRVRVEFSTPVADSEPFRSLPRNPPPLEPNTPRVVYRCPDHTDLLEVVGGRCPYDGHALEPQRLTSDQRVQWWCPAHQDHTSHAPGLCSDCGDRQRIPRITTFLPVGQVVAVPVSAIVNLGGQRVAYVERMPGMYDGVPVRLGPNCGDAFPVLSGLVPGDRVVTAGAFLLDAESRLNAGVANTYFGAGGGSSSLTSTVRRGDRSDVAAVTAALSNADRAWAEWQRTCPVTKLALGEMGELDRVTVRGRLVFLCCEGCRSSIAEDALVVPPPRQGDGQ